MKLKDFQPMKLKDFPDTPDLNSFKVRIPDMYRRKAVSAGLNTMDVHLYSLWATGIWVKTDMDSERVYPLSGIAMSETLEWEVVE